MNQAVAAVITHPGEINAPDPRPMRPGEHAGREGAHRVGCQRGERWNAGWSVPASGS